MEASAILDEIASQYEDLPLKKETTPSRNSSNVGKSLTFGSTNSKRKISPKKNFTNKIHALQKAITLKTKLSRRYCKLLKPEVQCQSKTD